MSEDGICLRSVWEHDPDYAVDIDDDGARVAYAYILKDGGIVGDVWLYNRGATPAEPEWMRPDARTLLPFKNPRGLAAPGRFAPLTAAAEVQIVWSRDPDGRVGAEVRIRGEVHARLLEGEKPGWCRLAARDGPIAKAL